MRPNQAFHALEVLRNSFSAPLSRKGIALSRNDSQTVLDVYQQWLLLLMDLGYLRPETLKRDAQRLWIDLIQRDVYDLNSCFAECLHSIRTQTIKGFKGLCSRISSHLYSHLRDDVELIPGGDVFAARRLIQLFSYTSRLSLQDIDLTQQLLEEYLEIEGRVLSDFPDDLVRSLNKIVRRWMGSFVPGDLLPQHGPGGVALAGRCSIEDKYKQLASDGRFEYAFGSPTWKVESAHYTLERISHTIFVPKSYKTFRTISMEPATLQYFQQSVWKLIDQQVSRNLYLRNRIGFHEQERNKLLAQLGSSSRIYATIDLSAASDSVSYALVKRVFRGTWLPRFFLAARSKKTCLPDGRIVNLKKFAPMGSALCFPVETMIFASICEHVTQEHHINGDYSVFGDDIIVPTQCVEDVMHILEQLGFTVNYSKSFYQSTCWFRESCGGEYCDGFDVTPMRVSREYASLEPDVRFTGLIDLANNAYRLQYRNLRYFFLRKLRDAGFVVLFSPTEVLGDSYSNYHTKHRWNKDLQRLEVKVTTLTAKYPETLLSHQDEEIRYRHWLESTSVRNRKVDRSYSTDPKIRFRHWFTYQEDLFEVDEGFESVICKPVVQVRETWRMKPYEPADQGSIDFYTGRGIKSPPL